VPQRGDIEIDEQSYSETGETKVAEKLRFEDRRYPRDALYLDDDGIVQK